MRRQLKAGTLSKVSPGIQLAKRSVIYVSISPGVSAPYARANDELIRKFLSVTKLFLSLSPRGKSPLIFLLSQLAPAPNSSEYPPAISVSFIDLDKSGDNATV